MEAISKKFRFIDKGRNFIEITIDTTRGYLSICGDTKNCFGQIYDDIDPVSELQRDFIDIWKNHHLKKISQKTLDRIINLVDAIKFQEQVYIKGMEEEYPSEYKDLIEAIKERTDINPNHVIAAARFFNYPVGIILQNITELSTNLYEVGGIPIYVGEWDELEKRAEEMLREGSCEDLWRMAVHEGGETRGLEEWLECVYDEENWYGILNTYNGRYDEFEIDNIWYYACRG